MTKHATAFTPDAAGTDLIAPLVLLQLSDLHFGPHSRFATSELATVAARCWQALDEARRDLGWHEPIALVLVTGDIAEAARPPEYGAAMTFFVALAERLALPPHRFVFVPGNHDVSWTRCRWVEDQVSDGYFAESELRDRIDAVKLEHFEKFIRDFHGGKARHEIDGGSVAPLRRDAFVHDFADLGVSVAALNSCERESHRKTDHVGVLSTEQAQSVLDHWRGAPAGRIRIAAVHHNPSSMASAAIEQWREFLRGPEVAASLTLDLVERFATNLVGFEGRDELKHLASDAYVSLIFHGHHHASAQDQSFPWRGRDDGGSGDTRILSAGSWGLSPESGKLPKDQPLVMQLVRIDPAAARLHPVLLTWHPNARLPGSVHRGRFVLDSQSRAERPVGLSLPPSLRGRFRPEPTPSAPPETAAPPVPRLHAELAAAIERYRVRRSGWSERLDLRGAGPTPITGNRPIDITLDEMYIPLRFAMDLDSTDLGAPLRPDDLLERAKPLVVVGAAGAGKTTWMRWTFRRLIRDSRAVPFFLELRTAVASQGAVRSVESYLADALRDGSSASDSTAIIEALLDDTSGPRPVILIDGWDELGIQGDRLRERLVEFCRAFPHVVVVVSSRPYGETRPAAAEAFETVYIQPLSDDDVRILALRFHRSVHGHDELAGIRATDEFMAALSAAPDARSLAGTALLLTMMLLLSREGPLPDRRHKLYTACLRNMLLHRVTQREQDGVPVAFDQWRPDDSEERLRVVAELAFRMQTEGYKRSWRAPMVRAWDEAVGLLEDHWTRDYRERFLRWLVASAGVLIDRTDHSIQFAHLSFQEHLAAYYLFISREGEDRVTVARSHMGDSKWWETLRLWAGLTGDQWPDKLSPVLDVLRADVQAYWLAGEIFADGMGRPSTFDAWVAELPVRLFDPFTSVKDCASAWGACKQAVRRGKITETLASASEGLHWLDGALHAQWSNLAKLEVNPAPTLRVLETPITSAAGVARSRVLHGAAASWPDGGELAVLRLWPSTRAAVSVRLQTAISLGGQMLDVAAMISSLLLRASEPWSVEDLARVQDLVRHLDRYLSSHSDRHFDIYFARHFGRDFIHHLARCLGREFAHDFFQDFAQDFCRYFTRGLLGYFGQCFSQHSTLSEDRYLARHFSRVFIQDFRQYLALDFSRYSGLNKSTLTAAWLPTFALLEASSVAGRAAPRATLAYGKLPEGAPLLALFRTACQASFAPGDTSMRDAAARACNAFEGDPLWPALARHVARISTPEDRELLADLARNPEKREPPVSWGLQTYARGDLAAYGDSLVTLDELCAQAGLSSLPFLDDMPDELDVVLDDAAT